MLLKAVDENKRLESVERTYSMTVAVIHAMDLSFNKGKGNILSTWIDAVAGDLMSNIKSKPEKKQIVSDRTMAFFEGMPKMVRKKRG